MKKLISILFILILFSCSQKKENFPGDNQITGLATPVRLNPGQTEIVLSDYFNDISLIDSVSLPACLAGELTSDKKYLLVREKEKELPPLMVMKVWIKGYPYSILMKKSGKEKVRITYDPGDVKVKSVQIAGEVNGWNPKNSNFTFNNGKWTIDLLLDPGTYQYKLVVDGQWIMDPANPDSADNNIGGFNSLLKVGTQKGKKPSLFTAKKDGKIVIGYKNDVESFFVFWQNYEIPAHNVVKSGNGYEITLPCGTKKPERSFVRAWAYNENGVSNDILIPLQSGKPVSSAKELTRHDWRASVFYFLMIDRFYDADTTNDFPVDNPEILPKANFKGGDIAGIIKKLEEGYFDSLGINTIWLSPITQNPLGAYGLWPNPRTKFSGYHGYWPVSSSKVDFRFGTAGELTKLVKLAHKHNINVILDYVANHVHELHPVYIEHPDWTTPLYLPDGTMNTEKWDEYRLTTWFDTFLPTLDLSREDVVDVMTDSALFWLENYNLDGFRHDATKHIPELFWRTLTKKIKEKVEIPQHKKVYQVGETYGNRELTGSYVNTGMLDGQFDFNVYDASVAVFARDNEPFGKLNEALHESIEYYGYHNLMGYITGNQDKPRFISLAGGSLKFDEDSKLAGWTRDIEVGDPVAYKKLQSLIAFNMTIPGIPTIYYGDEIGMPGANDPDNRRMMKFGNLSHNELKTREITAKLVHLRRNNLPLTYGDFQVLEVSDKVYVFARTYFDKIVIVAFNKSAKKRTVEFQIPARFMDTQLTGSFGAQFKKNGKTIKVSLEGNSFEILQ
jgi:glycosidase